jgi:AraC-like DNA-binding protein
LVHHGRVTRAATRLLEAPDDIVELVREKAQGEGRTASALPGVWFFRFDRPQPPAKARTSTMYLGFAAQGKKHVRVGGLELGYDRMSYLVLRGETDYEAQVVEASPQRPYLAMGIQIPPDVVVPMLLELVDGDGVAAPPGEAPPAFVSSVDERLVGALVRLIRALDDPAERRVLAPLALREIVFHLLRTEAAAVLRQAVTRNGERGRIRDAMAYIEERAASRLSVKAIARHVAMSPSHFAHRFREIASVSPMQYVKIVRMARARVLLLADGLAAAEAARAVGYASASHFTRDFKRHFGLSPSSYARAFDRGSTARASAAGGASSVA